ncbi:hypothetical protein [Moorena sp. SIO3H5]|nr:hypothetical protein [Moorena sp. SIO3H5]
MRIFKNTKNSPNYFILLPALCSLLPAPCSLLPKNLTQLKLV